MSRVVEMLTEGCTPEQRSEMGQAVVATHSADIMLINEIENLDFEVTPGITQVKLPLTVIDNDDLKTNP